MAIDTLDLGRQSTRRPPAAGLHVGRLGARARRRRRPTSGLAVARPRTRRGASAHEQRVLTATGLTPVVVQAGHRLRRQPRHCGRPAPRRRQRARSHHRRRPQPLGDHLRPRSGRPLRPAGHRARRRRASTTPPTKPTSRVLDIVEALSRNTTHKPDVRFVPIEEARAKLGTLCRCAGDGSGGAQPAGRAPWAGRRPCGRLAATCRACWKNGGTGRRTERSADVPECRRAECES